MDETPLQKFNNRLCLLERKLSRLERMVYRDMADHWKMINDILEELKDGGE